MKTNILAKFRQSITQLEQWYLATPERALEEAYKAALKIRQIENEHFQGNRIGPGSGHSSTVLSYFQSELKKYLKTIRMRLTEFKASNQMITPKGIATGSTAVTRRETSVSISTEAIAATAIQSVTPSDPRPDGTWFPEVEIINNTRPPLTLLEKLQFVDATLSRYQTTPTTTVKSTPIPAAKVSKSPIRDTAATEVEPNSLYRSEFAADGFGSDSKLDSGSFIPRSILRTANRFRRELDTSETTEDEVLQDFRTSKVRTKIAIRFLLLLIIVPLLTQQLSKNFVIGPLVDHFKVAGQIEQIINTDIEQRVLSELNQFEERLRFQNLITPAPNLSGEAMEEQVRQKALELANKYRWQLNEPFKNILADGLSLGAFTILLVISQPQIAILKSFMDEAVYGLSDSAKAFIIILFTDVFVGFHSPHGWTVIIENTLEHFGFPQNQDFIDMFIATFPVMLDAVFKYWIFRYLNQISPSAVATYRNMNE